MNSNYNQYYTLNLGSIEIKQTNQSLYRSWNRLHRFQKTLIILVILIFFLYTMAHIEFNLNRVQKIDTDHRHLTQENKEQINNNFENKQFNNVNKKRNTNKIFNKTQEDKDQIETQQHAQQIQKPKYDNYDEEKIDDKNDNSVLLNKLANSDKSSNGLNINGPTNERQKSVVQMFLHAWKAYKQYAWGEDELKPVSRTASSWFNLGLTIVDSLDTMYLMNLKDEFKQARDWVDKSLNLDVDRYNSLFEITIRIMGGLLSAFHLSGDRMFLDKAYDLGNRSLPAFHTKSHIPLSDINLRRRHAKCPSWTSDSSVAEAATIQIEFKELAHLTRDERFRQTAETVSEHFHKLNKSNGLVPIYINPYTGEFSGQTITLGARGDSYYEYLLKQWLQNGAKLDKDQDRNYYLLEDWLESVKGVNEKLVKLTKPNNLTFLGELLGDSFTPKMDHLVCFLPGNLALGATFLNKSATYPKEHVRDLMDLATRLTETCYQMYAQMQTGLSPEIVHFNYHEGSTQDLYVKNLDRHNFLRPETLESLYYMYKITGEKKYQDYGWKIFESFEKYTKIESGGYSSINDVTNVNNVKFRDKMESFFLAETLKYLYLLFEDENKEIVDLNKWIFNTEAHLLPLRQ